MFGGTPAVPDFDSAVSALGGECNAFTNTDFTNYYITLPSQHLARALALEADRMAGLDISQAALEVQQRVVTEEYHQRYANQPYGDVWLRLRPLCYDRHPYRWATIGADIRHVADATLDDVRAFHRRHYRPDNAILCTAAALPADEQLSLAAEAFGRLGDAGRAPRGRFVFPGDDVYRSGQRLQVEAEVPARAVYLVWPLCDHHDPRFRAADLLSDVLSNGPSSRFFRRLVVGGDLFTEADACISGEEGPNLFVVSAKLRDGAGVDRAVDALRREVTALAGDEPASTDELLKVQNKFEATFAFSQYKPSDRAMALCHYSWLGDTGLVDREPDAYRQVSADLMRQTAADFLVPGRENIMIYGQ